MSPDFINMSAFIPNPVRINNLSVIKSLKEVACGE